MPFGNIKIWILFFIGLLQINSSYADVVLSIDRESAFMGGVVNARIYINDEKKGEISSGGHLDLKVNPGENTIKVDKSFGLGEYRKTFLFEDNSTYEITIGPRNAMLGMALLGGIAVIADNLANKDEKSSDNGVFTIKKIEKKILESKDSIEKND